MHPDVARGDTRGAWELAVDVVVGDVEVSVLILMSLVDDRAEPEHDGLPRARRGDPRALAHLGSLSDAPALDDLHWFRERDLAAAGGGGVARSRRAPSPPARRGAGVRLVVGGAGLERGSGAGRAST